MNVWIFPVENRFIVRRNASFYKHRQMDIVTGEFYIHLIEGYPATMPTWEWVKQIGDDWFAGHNGRLYEINDVYPFTFP